MSKGFPHLSSYQQPVTVLFPPPRDKRAVTQGWALQRGTRGQAAWLVEHWAAFACPGLGDCWARPGAIAITRQAGNRKHGAHVLEAECTWGNVVTPSLTDPPPSAPKSSRRPPLLQVAGPSGTRRGAWENSGLRERAGKDDQKKLSPCTEMAILQLPLTVETLAGAPWAPPSSERRSECGAASGAREDI